MNIAFFGTPVYAVSVLEALKEAKMLPSLIITQPDKPVGRKRVITPPPVKEWALENNIEILQPDNLKDNPDVDALINTEWDLFIVAAYGLILPKSLLDKPKYKTLNIHPSLLPKYRGATPVPAQILNDDRHTGVTVMQLDEKMDHGPIISQASITIEEEDWPLRTEVMLGLLWEEGAKLLIDTLEPWMNSELEAKEQDHSEATFCGKFTKDDGEISLEDDPYQNHLKYCAFGDWPGTFFFIEKNSKKLRVKIKEAMYEGGTFTPLRVVPEGKSEMLYEEFLQHL